MCVYMGMICCVYRECCFSCFSFLWVYAHWLECSLRQRAQKLFEPHLLQDSLQCLHTILLRILPPVALSKEKHLQWPRPASSTQALHHCPWQPAPHPVKSQSGQATMPHRVHWLGTRTSSLVRHWVWYTPLHPAHGRLATTQFWLCSWLQM